MTALVELPHGAIVLTQLYIQPDMLLLLLFGWWALQLMNIDHISPMHQLYASIYTIIYSRSMYEFQYAFRGSSREA